MDVKESLYYFLNSYGKLSPDELQLVCGRFEPIEIKKNNHFMNEGRPCHKIAFLVSGLISSYVHDTNANRSVKYFVTPGQFFTDVDAYEHHTQAQLNMQALVDSRLLVILRSKNEELISELPVWEYLQSTIAANALNNMIKMRHFLCLGNAKEKYMHLLEKHPDIIRNAPLTDIASFLGVTLSSLSRIRRDL